ncbi:MAG: DUF551 domain-containing protein [Clostridia bacterium]|nr:DUF551 domain-containing protein [Clostridia bacterium]
MPKKQSKGWISVQDELPEDQGHYIVLWDDGEIGQGVFFPGTTHTGGYLMPRWLGESESRSVTHWQPYPLNPGVL